MTLLFRNLLFIIVLPGTVAVYLPLMLIHGRPVASAGMVVIAMIFVGFGGAVVIRCVWDFAVSGKATPAPIDAPKKLVMQGLYRYTRNPMYLGVLSIIIGWAMMFESAVLLYYAIYTALFLQGFVILYEERHLRKLFGDEYDQYCTRVNRWLPRLFRRPSV